jgi:hypothetical protein
MWLTMLIMVLVKLWLVEGQNLYARGLLSYDDLLFVSLADYLLKGQWLGPYDTVTLIKGPFYPMWIAFSFTLGLPLLSSEHLLYIAACLVLVIAIRPVANRPLFLLSAFGFILFNPLSYNIHVMTRVTREGIYPALTLLVASTAIGMLVRQESSARFLWLWSCGLGLSLAAFWLTREEGVWIVPLLGLLFAFAVYRLWRSKPVDWKKKLAYWGLALVIWVALTGLVSGMNRNYYGLFAKTELDAPAFKSAYGALTRVKSKTWYPMIPVTKRARMQIYDVSPAFAELKPYLEGERGQLWAGLGADIKEIRKEIKGGWFVWAFREAVALAGYYSAGRFPEEYYRRLAEEIDRACEAGHLECLPARSSMSPPWHNEYLRPVLRKSLEGGWYLVKPGDLTALSDFSSSGPEEALQKFRRLSREKLEGDPMMPPALMHQTQAELTKVQILENLGRLYRLVLPYLSILALLGYIYLGIILIQRKGDALIWVILTSVLLAVLARIVLLAIIDVTSFYAVTLYYLSPAFLLFQAFIVVSWFGCLQSLIKDWHPHWSRSAPEKR